MTPVTLLLVALVVTAPSPDAASAPAPAPAGRADTLEALNAARAKAGLLPRKRTVRARPVRSAPRPVTVVARAQAAEGGATGAPAQPASAPDESGAAEFPAAAGSARQTVSEPAAREAELPGKRAAAAAPPVGTGYIRVVLDAARAIQGATPARRGPGDVSIESVRASAAGLHVVGTVALRGDGIALGLVRGGAAPPVALAGVARLAHEPAAATPLPAAATRSANPAAREVLSFRRVADGRVVQVIREADGTLTEVTRDAGGHLLSFRPLPGGSPVEP